MWFLTKWSRNYIRTHTFKRLVPKNCKFRNKNSKTKNTWPTREIIKKKISIKRSLEPRCKKLERFGKRYQSQITEGRGKQKFTLQKITVAVATKRREKKIDDKKNVMKILRNVIHWELQTRNISQISQRKLFSTSINENFGIS